jgi:hypothetical protein
MIAVILKVELEVLSLDLVYPLRPAAQISLV